MPRDSITEKLPRRLGLFPLVNIVVANMVGAGIFTSSGLLLEDLRDPRLMIALWVVAGGIALCGALCYGEVGAAIPRAGGEYTFLSRLYGPRLGFLSGWLSFFAGFSAPIALSAIGSGEYLLRAFPALAALGAFAGDHAAEVVKRLYALVVIGAFTALHMRGIVVGTRVQNVLTILKVALIAVLIALGFASGRGDAAHFSGEPFALGSFADWRTIGLSLMWISFAYSGWNAAAYIGSEIKDPARNLPRSLLLGTTVVIVLYVAFNLFFVYAAPAGDLAGVISVAGLAAGRLFGEPYEVAVSVLISFALLSSLSAFVILGPRVYYSMARDGLFFDFAARVHPRHRVPDRAILLQGIVAAALVVVGTFEQILTYMGFALGIFPLGVAAGVFKLRRARAGRFRMPGFPVVPLVFMTFGLVILTLAFLERPLISGIALGTTGLGLPVYYLLRYRQRSVRSGADPKGRYD